MTVPEEDLSEKTLGNRILHQLRYWREASDRSAKEAALGSITDDTAEKRASRKRQARLSLTEQKAFECAISVVEGEVRRTRWSKRT